MGYPGLSQLDLDNSYSFPLEYVPVFNKGVQVTTGENLKALCKEVAYPYTQVKRFTGRDLLRQITLRLLDDKQPTWFKRSALLPVQLINVFHPVEVSLRKRLYEAACELEQSTGLALVLVLPEGELVSQWMESGWGRYSVKKKSRVKRDKTFDQVLSSLYRGLTRQIKHTEGVLFTVDGMQFKDYGNIKR